MVTIFAAASLTEVFQQTARSFSESGYSSNVVFNFAGSQQLTSQLREGAHADIFAPADQTQMQAAIVSGRVEKTNVKTFACNRLIIGYAKPAVSRTPTATALTSPIESLPTLAQPGHKIVVGAEGVPIGRYTRQFLANAAADARLGPEFRNGFEANVVSQEHNVRGVLGKLLLGEADAGILYATDLVGRAPLPHLEIPAHLNVSVTYPIALVQGGPQPEQAAAFVAFLFSRKGTDVLQSHGFSTQCRTSTSQYATGASLAQAFDNAIA